MTIQADGWSHASLTLDPTNPATSGDSTVAVLATEYACASGRTPPPQDIYTRVDETESVIKVLVMVKNASGGQTCPSNPPFPLAIQLKTPIGERQFLDASVIPAILLQ